MAEVNLLDRTMLENPAIATRPQVAATARSSLRHDPLNPAALRFLAMAAEARSDLPGALALARLSERVTRRDLLTQAMLIEAAVQGGDTATALVHYDRALRTKVNAPALLFPILRAAIEDREIRRALRPYIGADRPWTEAFLREALSQGTHPGLVADLLLTPPRSRARITLASTLSSRMISDLSAARDYETARTYYLTLSGADPMLLTATALDVRSTDARFIPLAWQTMDTAQIGVTFEQGETENGRHAHVQAGPGASATVLRKVLLLPPGNYVATDVRESLAAGPRASAYWQLSCVNRGAPAVPIWTSKAGKSEQPVIPAGCSIQMVELVVTGGDGQEGIEFVVRRFELKRR